MGPAPAQVLACDWDALFQAVRGRLVQLAASAAPHETRPGVLECVDALALLASHLARERADHRDQALQLIAARAALAEARVEIVGVRSNERRSRRLAFHDELTTLPNRSFFAEWLDHVLVKTDRLPQSLAVLYLDLDGFKRINDTHGHGVGDEVLRIVGSRLARAVRAEDVVSRLGGDEFACALAPVPERNQLGELARKLFASVSAPITIGAREVAVRPSIGIALCPGDGATAGSLLHNADAAMYHAKRLGSGFAFFDESAGGAPGQPATAPDRRLQ